MAPFDGKRVLVAEDDSDVRGVMARSLRALGLDVTEADDGGRMLVALASRLDDKRPVFDLIVTDVRMPVLDGLEVLRGLRAAQRSTPLVIVTADDGSGVRAAAARFGAVVLPKPLDLDQLEATVREQLSRPATSPGATSNP